MPILFKEFANVKRVIRESSYVGTIHELSGIIGYRWKVFILISLLFPY
jgi:hypothetical protein